MFCLSVLPSDGPLEGMILKTYRGGRDPEVLELLARRHDAYLDCLRLAGFRVPDTDFRLLDEAGFLRPVILQTAMHADAMLTVRFTRASVGDALAMLDEVAALVADFWRRVAQRPERIGLRAGLESFALDADGPIFLDTFLPLITYSRDEIGRLVHRFSDRGVMYSLSKVLPGRARDVQDRWYSPAGTLGMLVDSALRARPADAAMILDWAHQFAMTRVDGPARAAMLAALARHGRSPATGDTLRADAGIGQRPHA